jgi:GNAT superfamily N-acetyltransferase
VRPVKRCALLKPYPNEWHRVAQLVVADLLNVREPDEASSMEGLVLLSSLDRFGESTNERMGFPLDAERDRAVVLVAEDARGQIVGTCRLCVSTATGEGVMASSAADHSPFLALARALLGRAGPTNTFAPRAFLDSLVVSSECRGLGVGRALMTEAEAFARAWGYESVLLRVESGNPARAFYERLGYATPAGCATAIAGKRLVAVRRSGWVDFAATFYEPMERRLAEPLGGAPSE